MSSWIPYTSSRTGLVILDSIYEALAHMGRVLGLWRPNVTPSLPSVPYLGLNVTLEGHDITPGVILRCNLILFCPYLICVKNWPGRPSNYELKLISSSILYK
jgi:hypothetical protein